LYLFYVFEFGRLRMVDRQERLFDLVTIALVGKYTDLKDSYMSVVKALEHSALRVNRKLIIEVSVTC
jgi:CTP synthase